MVNKFARNLRKNLTPQEKKLWNIIRNKQFYGYRFLRQYPFKNYILDFVCCSKKIVIEIDGGQHNDLLEIKHDEQRTEILSHYGYTVIRFWNNEIDYNIEGVIEKLKEVFGIFD